MDKRYSEFRFASLAALLVIGTGTIFYHFAERFSWLDAIYFCITTLATVGYGDLVPKTPLGKVFTIFYILAGIGILAYFANALFTRAYHHRVKKRKSREN